MHFIKIFDRDINFHSKISLDLHFCSDDVIIFFNLTHVLTFQNSHIAEIVDKKNL